MTKKEERKDVHDQILMNKSDFIIACTTGAILVLIVWGVSFVSLYYMMKNKRTAYFAPKTVRFTRLNNETPQRSDSVPRRHPTSILKPNEVAYIELGTRETAI